MQNGAQIKRTWMNSPDSFFDAPIFKNLKVGDRFIVLPSPGDNLGHGGFWGVHHIFEKQTDGSAYGYAANYLGQSSMMTNEMPVLQVR